MMRIYTNKKCDYCNELKKSLDEEGYQYFEVDIENEKYKEECEKVFKYAGVAAIPIILKKPHMLVPTKSFNTIEQAIQLIKSFD